MIPKDIKADVLLYQALISDWQLQVMSTNWSGYWIIQLISKKQRPLAMLIHLNNLAAICNGLRLCIDAAKNPSKYPGVKTMYQTLARELPTSHNNDGAMSVVSEWKTEPVVLLSYYGGRSRSDGVIKQGLHVDDALEFYNCLSVIYEQFPNKQDWVPHI